MFGHALSRSEIVRSGRLSPTATVSELNTAENQLLLKSLDAALVLSKAKPGSLEALIDALVDVVSCKVDIFSDELDPRYLRLIEAGFEAVPVLSNHLDDIRLTRVYWPGFNNFRGYHLQVRHLVSGLLEGLAVERFAGAYVSTITWIEVSPDSVGHGP